MARLSKNNSDFTPNDVSMIGRILDNVIQSGSAFDPSVQSDSGAEILRTLNNMMDVSVVQLGAAEKANRSIQKYVYNNWFCFVFFLVVEIFLEDNSIS